jgi:hypothetical protein
MPNALRDYRIYCKPDVVCQRRSLFFTVGNTSRPSQVCLNCLQNAKNAVCVKTCLVSWSHCKRVCVAKSNPVVIKCVFQVMAN